MINPEITRLNLPLEGLLSEARSCQEKIALLWLVRDHLIREQKFAKAAKCRDVIKKLAAMPAPSIAGAGSAANIPSKEAVASVVGAGKAGAGKAGAGSTTGMRFKEDVESMEGAMLGYYDASDTAISGAAAVPNETPAGHETVTNTTLPELPEGATAELFCVHGTDLMDMAAKPELYAVETDHMMPKEDGAKDRAQYVPSNRAIRGRGCGDRS